ncbi:enoyl-ACP reductase FabI [Parenemella sanctibonifatiensis]|uniref:Enoyl-[acyl-carrier-protein] reductase [NADH] n=1 Tax=Parenemella sanctibonifatiensis TaxID=2016505 RepID=A0A255EFQ7_9ACTN|nr:enoyl-ACP reductase FabI [Parenemella sanctibonifatiensis]OYN88272.1 enoyl-[acyl-carrier-protein] reductase [Parenemella sanctibonifatiensis]
MSGLVEGKTFLVTGVTAPNSIAFSIARIIQEQGGTVVVSNVGRALGLTKRIVRRLPTEPPVIELDVTDADQLAGLPDALRSAGVGRLDGVVHSIAYANPETALGGAYMSTEWSDVSTALHISAYSYVSLVRACQPLFGESASVVGLTFDATVSWPTYDWMGVSKAALESASRYLARYLGAEGVRSNLVAAGPLDTIAKTAIPGADQFNQVWTERAPLGWDAKDAEPAAKAAVALLSDWFPATTGEMIHVDGGIHSTGA